MDNNSQPSTSEDKGAGKEQRESTTQQLRARLPDMLVSRRGSKRSTEIPHTEFPSEPSPANRDPPFRGVLKPATVEDSLRASVATVSFVPANQPRRESLISQPERRKSSVYNPFTSFEKRVSISATEPPRPPDRARTPSIAPRDTYPRRSVGSLYERRHTDVPMVPQAAGKRSIAPGDLTKQDISVCFFPEEPDWDDEDDLYEYGRKDSLPFRRFSQLPTVKIELDERYMDERERWSSRLVYLISLISYSISFSNVYHFPALVYHFGGLSFIIPYTFFTIVMGYPLHFLVSSLGQYSQSGPVRIWNCAPIARGIGWSMFLLCVFVAYFQNMYAAYSAVYFSRCFNQILPWQDCDDPLSYYSNFSCVPRMCAHTDSHLYTPAEHYFFDHVLQVQYSNEILQNGLGPMIWTQALGFFLSWVFVYFAVIQSVRSIGRVTFYLIIFPYFVLFMLLTAGFLLEGSSRGLYMLFNADFGKMLDLQLWRAAAEQVFFELGICQGTPLAYASYCHHRNPTHIDSAIICTINYFTSILCALVIFNVLGALSMEMGTPLYDVIHQGPALVYIVYPEALSRVPGAHFWCVAFFLMLFSVCVGTQIAVVETALCVIYDEFNDARPYRWLLNLIFCVSLFCIGIILCTANGFYIVHLLNTMAARMPRLPIAVCTIGTIVFIYGMRKYCEDMHFMLNYYPLMFVRVCLFLTPFLLLALTISSWATEEGLVIRGFRYVKDAIVIGWFSIFFILIWILLGSIYWITYCKYMGYPTRYIWKSLTSWGPRSFEERVARTEFSSEQVSNFTESWNKKNTTEKEEDYY